MIKYCEINNPKRKRVRIDNAKQKSKQIVYFTCGSNIFKLSKMFINNTTDVLKVKQRYINRNSKYYNTGFGTLQSEFMFCMSSVRRKTNKYYWKHHQTKLIIAKKIHKMKTNVLSSNKKRQSWSISVFLWLPKNCNSKMCLIKRLTSVCK